jgi:hypothetical protein
MPQGIIFSLSFQLVHLVSLLGYEVACVDIYLDKELFPKELWSTLEGEDGEEARKHINRAAERKSLILSGMQIDPSAKTRVMLEKITSVVGEDGEEMEDEAVVEDGKYHARYVIALLT